MARVAEIKWCTLLYIHSRAVEFEYGCLDCKCRFCLIPCRYFPQNVTGTKKADNTPQLINHLFVDLSFWHTFNNRSLIWWLQLQLHMNCHNIWHLTIVNTTITDCLKKFCSVVQKQWLCSHKSYIYLSDCFRSSFCDRSPFLQVTIIF